MKNLKLMLVGMSWIIVGYCSQYLGATTLLVALSAALTTAVILQD